MEDEQEEEEEMKGKEKKETDRREIHISCSSAGFIIVG